MGIYSIICYSTVTHITEIGDKMRIAICDDEKILQNIVKDLCEKILSFSLVKYEIVLFNKGNDLLNYDKEIDILILDIGMPGLDGLSVAHLLRQKGNETYIIFLTSHYELMQKAFKVKAFRYLVKPVEKNELKEALDEAIKEIVYTNKILINHKSGKTMVRKKDIIYIESLGDNTSVYLKDIYYICKEPLKYWISLLDFQEFFHVHKSYLIGLAHVVQIEGNTVIMANNNKVPISIRNSKAFKDKLKEYIRLNAK